MPAAAETLHRQVYAGQPDATGRHAHMGTSATAVLHLLTKVTATPAATPSLRPPSLQRPRWMGGPEAAAVYHPRGRYVPKLSALRQLDRSDYRTPTVITSGTLHPARDAAQQGSSGLNQRCRRRHRCSASKPIG